MHILLSNSGNQFYKFLSVEYRIGSNLCKSNLRVLADYKLNIRQGEAACLKNQFFGYINRQTISKSQDQIMNSIQQVSIP